MLTVKFAYFTKNKIVLYSFRAQDTLMKIMISQFMAFLLKMFRRGRYRQHFCSFGLEILTYCFMNEVLVLNMLVYKSSSIKFEDIKKRDLIDILNIDQRNNKICNIYNISGMLKI